MSNAKEIIGQAFGLAHRNSCYPHASKDESDVAAGIIIGRLEAAGFRILAPDELDPPTVERCAHVAKIYGDIAADESSMYIASWIEKDIRTLTGGNNGR